MEFCPTCGNMLQIEQANLGKRARYFCPTCPYVCEIERKITRKHPLVKKEVDPVFSGKDELKFAPKTEANCPYCNFGQAFFLEMQTRSADEPSTRFYKCCNESCQRQWRED